MEVFKKYLGNLQKVGFDYLRENLEEGDVIYKILGNSVDLGNMDMMKIADGTIGGMSYFCEDPKTGVIKEIPVLP